MERKRGDWENEKKKNASQNPPCPRTHQAGMRAPFRGAKNSLDHQEFQLRTMALRNIPDSIWRNPASECRDGLAQNASRNAGIPILSCG
jgi:hypothetical protein